MKTKREIQNMTLAELISELESLTGTDSEIKQQLDQINKEIEAFLANSNQPK